MTTEKLLKLPMVKWQKALDKMSTEQRGGLSRELSALTQRAAQFHSYAEERYGYGCGDQGHEAAVKKSNRLLAKVRRAMGYANPRADVSF